MDTVFVIVQVLLGIVFLGTAIRHIQGAGATTLQPRMEWIAAVPPTFMRTIGVLEIAGGLSLIGTVVTGTTWLAALTAACFVVLMIFAAVFHARRANELPNIAFNAILGVMGLIVLYANLT